MEFVFGRDNLALTVFVPFDCPNDCKFCTSKDYYRRLQPSIDGVKKQMKLIFKSYHFPIKDVVFTGGEPMADVAVLKELIEIVPSTYNIYINTTYINHNLTEFVNLVNGCDKIKGVNISRHCETYDADCATLCDIAEDSAIHLLNKPVRINCVLTNQDIEKVILRWSGKNVHLCFRKDYTKTKDDVDLHNPYNEISLKIRQLGFTFKAHSQCNVCDTTTFEKNNELVSYHKGKKTTSMLRKDVMEINDLIIKQDGGFTYDWDDYLDKQTIFDYLSHTFTLAALLTEYYTWSIFSNQKESNGRNNSKSPYRGCGTGGGC